MAVINANVYSPAQWQLAIKPEATYGTKNVGTMQLVNVDSGVSITDAPTIFNEYRSGSGRTKKSVDYFATEEGSLKTISFSGVADTTVLPILLENCVGVAESSGTVDVAYNYSGTSFKIGGTGAANIKSLTVALVSPIAANTRVYAGCVVDQLTITDDAGADGGRRRFSATLLSRDNPSNDQATPSSMAVYGATYYSFWDLETKKAVDGNDMVMNKVELSIKSNVKIIGVGTDGKGEVIDRGVPGIEITGSVGVKYDANTMSLYQDFADGDDIVIQVSNHATIGSASMGFKATQCKITGDLNPGDADGAVFIDIPFEVLAGTSGSMIEIAI